MPPQPTRHAVPAVRPAEPDVFPLAERAPVAVGQRGIQINTLEDLYRFAKAVVLSGLAPKGMDKAETILVAIQLGMELGMSPMSSLQNIAIINGRPGIFGDAALALVRASGLLEDYTQEVTGAGDALVATVTSKRVGFDPIVSTFSMTDAKRAGLLGKSGPWAQYPERMLLFRARGFNLRDNFGDVLKGLRTTEELQDIPATGVRHAAAPAFEPPAGEVVPPAAPLPAPPAREPGIEEED